MQVVTIEKIKELSQQGLHKDCLQACEKLLKENPKEVNAWMYLGQCWHSLGEHSKAIESLMKAFEIDNFNPKILRKIGDIFLITGDHVSAIKWLEESLKYSNADAAFLINLARLKNKSGRNKEAIDLFKKAIEYDPLFVDAFIGLADC